LWLSKIALAGGGVLALILGGIAVRRWSKTSARFALKEIRVQYLDSAGRSLPEHPGISDGDLTRLLSTPVGTNYFAVKPKESAREVSAHPWVKSASAEKQLPGRLLLRVVLRQPAAVVALGGLYLVDDSGEAFKRVLPGEDPDRV